MTIGRIYSWRLIQIETSLKTRPKTNYFNLLLQSTNQKKSPSSNTNPIHYVDQVFQTTQQGSRNESNFTLPLINAVPEAIWNWRKMKKSAIFTKIMTKPFVMNQLDLQKSTVGKACILVSWWKVLTRKDMVTISLEARVNTVQEAVRCKFNPNLKTKPWLLFRNPTFKTCRWNQRVIVTKTIHTHQRASDKNE